MPIESIPDLLEAYKRNFNPSRAEGLTGTVQLHITGEGGGEWYLTFDNGAFDTHEGTTDDPTVEVTSGAQDWILMSIGKANPMMLMMGGKLKVKGSIALATKFQSLFGS